MEVWSAMDGIAVKPADGQHTLKTGICACVAHGSPQDSKRRRIVFWCPLPSLLPAEPGAEGKSSEMTP